jgi:hypothetical protein
VGFVVDKVALGQVFLRDVGFPLSISFHRCSIIWKNEKAIIFITGLHNASVASAAGHLKKTIEQDIKAQRGSR